MSTVQKKPRKNRVASPPNQSPIIHGEKSEVFELFTIKTRSDSQDTTSEISDDVFIKPKTTFSTPSKSETTLKSYRDRINERYKSIKEKAGKSTKKANVFKETTERILLERVRKESNEIDDELEMMRERFKLGQKPKTNDIFEFFCKEKSNETDADKVENDNSKCDLEFELPQTVNRENSEGIFFVPQAKAVDISDKIENDEPRFLQDEGFYIPPKPQISNWKLKLLEQRLAKDNKKWFNCDGSLNLLQTPLQNASYRPNIKTCKLEDVANYNPARIADPEFEEIVVVQENLLKLQLSSIQFIHHPLFSLEHVLAQKLKKLFNEYEESIMRNNFQRLNRRIDGLRQLLRQFEDTSSQSDGEESKFDAYRRDIRILQDEIFAEGEKERTRMKKILQIWKSIKKLRQTNKYSNTSIRLIIRKEETNYEEEKFDFDKKIDELCEEYNDRKEILEKYQKSFRAPGEPILYFSLVYDNEITKDLDNQKEITRRNVINSTKIALKIICNRLEVCKTSWVNLTDEFACSFNDSISIQLSSIPKFLTIEIIEQTKSLLRRSLGELTLTLPARNSHQNDNKLEFFEKNELVHYKHEGVGSGVNLKELIDDLDDAILTTSGFLAYCITWKSLGVDTTPEKLINQSGTLNRDVFSDWLEKHQPDPQDPRNSILFEFSRENFTPSSKSYFRLDNQMEKWQFCPFEMIDNNLRFQILQLRDANEPEFDRMLVPNRIKEIPLDILSDYKRRKELLEEEDDDNQGKKQLKQIQIKVFQKCKNYENNLNYEDVIDEKFLPQLQKWIQNFLNNVINWFQWRPFQNLPQLTLQAPKLTNYDLQSQIQLSVHLISGLNMPTRNNHVEVFIQAEYNNYQIRSALKLGPHPMWNEKIFLPLEPSHLDYLNPNSLNGKIILNLFDGKDGATNWLGSLEISLAAICQNGIQGMFRVKTPKLIDYDEPKETYLNLQIEIQPLIPKLNPSIEDLPCSDLPYIKDHILAWNREFNMNYPNRKFSVLAIDPNGTTSCIIRYIKALEPPQINIEGFDVTPLQCLRYISLIPFSDSNQFYQNIWLPVEKFIQFKIGSIIDHAVALTCFLLALKLEVWLLLGLGVPYGSTAFVLIKEYTKQIPNFYLFDVAAGRRVNLDETFCPLIRVYCVVNEANIWANIQRSDDVATLRLDFSRRSDWLPLFNRKIPAPTISIHGILNYQTQIENNNLEIILDRKIRKKFAKSRQLHRTIWNHHVSNNFKTILVALEKTEMFGKSNNVDEQIEQLKNSYEIRGHIVNLPFTDTNSILKKVKTFGLHLNEDDTTQFASACYIKSYTNQVLSVWIFLAAVQEKNF